MAGSKTVIITTLDGEGKEENLKHHPTILLLTIFLRKDVFAQVLIWYVKDWNKVG